jgi:hypothetical protein
VPALRQPDLVAEVAVDVAATIAVHRTHGAEDVELGHVFGQKPSGQEAVLVKGLRLLGRQQRAVGMGGQPRR